MTSAEKEMNVLEVRNRGGTGRGAVEEARQARPHKEGVVARDLKERATELYLGRASLQRGTAGAQALRPVTGWFLRSVLVWPSRVNERG